MTGDEYTALCAEIAAFTELDRTWTDVVGIFGEPSVLFGGSNPLYGKSLGYATANVSDPMVIFHLWNGVDPGAEPNWPPKVFGSGLAGDPLRRRLFPRLLLFTPEGHRRRPRI